MSTLGDWLVRLETRLQALIEGNAARLFPGRLEDDLCQGLVEAMQAGLQPREMDSGTALCAPDQYLLTLPGSQVQALQEDPELPERLARRLEQAAQQAGVVFEFAPIVRLAGDPGIQKPRLTAAFSDEKDHTSMLELAQGTQPPRGHSPLMEIDLIAEAPPGAFLVVDGLYSFPLEQPVIDIGRGAGNHLLLEDERVSRRHAQLRLIEGRFTIFDLDSTGGTYVNGKPIRQQALTPGDVISLAGVPLVYGEDSDLSEKTQEMQV